MKHILSLFAAGLLATACGDDKVPAVQDDAGIDAPPAVVGPCIDRPTDLPHPPTGALPCELLPPGFTAMR